MNLKRHEISVLDSIVEAGIKNASNGLSQMTGAPIALGRPRVSFVPLREVPGIAGGPEAVVVAVYLGVEGDLEGHQMLLFSTEGACRLVEMLMGEPPGSLAQLDDMGHSALAECGNVSGSFFLNSLASATGLTIVPTSPAVVTDMAGAILEAVVAELYLAGDEAMVVETDFNGTIPGHFLLLPDQASMARLIAALESMG